MAKQLVAEVRVDAAPEAVWHVLTDLDDYPAWNPFIVRAAGVVEPSGRLTLTMQPVGGRAMTLRPRLVEVHAPRRLTWRGTLGVPRLMDAEHTFTLEPSGEGTRLIQRERFRGVLVPFVGASLDRGTLPAFVAMNQALKDRVERMASNSRG